MVYHYKNGRKTIMKYWNIERKIICKLGSEHTTQFI